MIHATPIGERDAELADTLAAQGDLRDPRWRDGLSAVPRHLFVPEVAWAAPDEGDGYRIDRAADPHRWLAAAYADHPIITQFDDGAIGAGAYTSSLSAPGAVLSFLELLAPRDGDRVLEVGTGTGWTAGLLAWRLGDENVVSVEIDADVAERARANLAAAGRTPTVVVGDAATARVGGPYDLIHVTCGITTVPDAWVKQTRPGGTIVLPWMPELGEGRKVRLVVGPDGTASGSFDAGDASYMMLRSQRGTPPPPLPGDRRERRTALDPRRVFGTPGAEIATTGLYPDLSATVDGTATVRLWRGDSIARVTWPTVECSGPADLWTEVEEAFHRWTSWGEPAPNRFGLTVTPRGQHVYLDDPSNIISGP